MPGTIHCLNCSHVIPRDYWNEREETTCRGCGERVQARVFPVFDRVLLENASAARIQAEGDSSCFYHSTNQAAIACDDCGRFLCTLCDLDVDGRHLCPACLERGVFVEKAASLEDRRTLYDSIALHLVTWPLVTFWFPIFTAPTAIFLVFRHWNTPMSILPRTRVRLWIALVLGLVEVGGILAMIFVLIWAVLKAGPK